MLQKLLKVFVVWFTLKLYKMKNIFLVTYNSVSHLIVSNEVNVNTTLLQTVLPIWQK